MLYVLVYIKNKMHAHTHTHIPHKHTHMQAHPPPHTHTHARTHTHTYLKVMGLKKRFWKEKGFQGKFERTESSRITDKNRELVLEMLFIGNPFSANTVSTQCSAAVLSWWCSCVEVTVQLCWVHSAAVLSSQCSSVEFMIKLCWVHSAAVLSL